MTSTQTKLILALCVSAALNIVLAVIMLQPIPPQDDTALQHELARKREEINAYKEQIIERDIRIGRNQAVQDSLRGAITARKIKLQQDNEDVYKIPDSTLNDTVHSILNGI